MILELVLAAALTAIALGIVLAPAVRWRRSGRHRPADADPSPLEETARGQALLAIKELEFDHATAKVDDADYAVLKAKFTAEALAALRVADRQTVDALIESRRARLEGRAPGCAACGAALPEDARFCPVCGLPV
jgi:hypothetical protein